MKTQKSGFLTALLVIFAIGASAQSYSFKVLATKGANELNSGSGWEPLKIGATLNKGDEVRLAPNAYLGLVHSTGKPLEVKAARSYKVSELEEQVGETTTVLKKYTDFILSGEEGPSNRLTATGAVHRDIGLRPEQIRLLLPDNQRASVFNNTVTVRWTSTDVQGPYVVTVRNMFEDVLDEVETRADSYVLDIADEKFANETALLVEVSAKSDKSIVSRSKLIKRLSPAEIERIAGELKAMGETSLERSAMNQYILANFYEQNNLIIDAISAFEQVIALEPEVSSFRDEYDAFLQRNQLQ